MNAPDCICSPGRLPLGAFCAGRDDLEREALHDDRISIRAPRAGCDFLRLQDIARALISIHAPRVGRDLSICDAVQFSMLISIHAPRVGRDNSKFPVGAKPKHFNPRAPCGARQHRRAYTQNQSAISIHAPRVGRDPSEIPAESILSNFNPRAPCGARRCRQARGVLPAHFNPRAPCGARHPAQWAAFKDMLFQSTRPVWGATKVDAFAISGIDISIHAPRVGRDDPAQWAAFKDMLFQSTRPVWGATANLTILPRQICTKGTKEFLLGRKTHGKKEK